MTRYVALLPGLVLCGCAPSPAVQAQAAADLVAMVQESIGEYSGGAHGQPFVAVDLSERSSYPQASTRGYFAESSGCVVFRPVTGTLLTPIFPRGTRLVSNANGNLELLVEASQVSFGRAYVVGGGEVALTGSGIALAAPVPANCPTIYYLVGSIVEP